MKKNKTNKFDLCAYMYEVANEIEDSYWRSDSEFMININNEHVFSKKSVMDTVIASIEKFLSNGLQNVVLTGVSNNQLMFQISETGKAKKRMLSEMIRRRPISYIFTNKGFIKYDCDLKYLIIVNREGDIYGEMTNINPNEKQEAINFSFKLITEGLRVYGRYDLLKLEYEQTGSISYNH